MLPKWDQFNRRLKEEFNADLVAWTGAIVQFFDDPVLFLKKQISLKDFVFLEMRKMEKSKDQDLESFLI